ncbi:MAG: DUF1963 domain-containing protein [Sumerlaeia bacterium]
MTSPPAKLLAHRRPAWAPVLSPAGGSLSHFGGLPLLGPGVEWPVCPLSERPMTLFLQLLGDDLPGGCGAVAKGHLLQVFYTPDADAALRGEAWKAFSPAHHVRVVAADGLAPAEPAPRSRNFPVKAIAGWEALDDFPMIEELTDHLGVEVTFREMGEFENNGWLARKGDKLGGWPAWANGAAYPRNPATGERLEPVFQIASRGGVPFMFGDLGTAHVFRVPGRSDGWTLSWSGG